MDLNKLTELLERCHPFLIHALCTIPADSKEYLEAKSLSKELDNILYPEVKRAFEIDAKRYGPKQTIQPGNGNSASTRKK